MHPCPSIVSAPGLFLPWDSQQVDRRKAGWLHHQSGCIIGSDAAGRAWEVLLSVSALQRPENMQAMLEAARLQM